MPAFQQQKIKGIILIELMISICISLVIICLLTEIYTLMQSNTHRQQSLRDIQHQAANIKQILSSDIGMAGYIGCARLTNQFPLALAGLMNLKNPIQVNAHDVTTVHASESHASLLKDMSNRTSLLIRREFVVKPRDVLIISDCAHAEIFTVASISVIDGNIKITPQQPLQYHFLQNSEIAKLIVNTYYIARSKRIDELGHAVMSLYVAEITGRQTELVTGVNEIAFKADYCRDKISGITINMILSAQRVKKQWIQYIPLGGPCE